MIKEARALLVLGMLALVPSSGLVMAQSLEDELSVLDDLPEADLSGAAPADNQATNQVTDQVEDVSQLPEDDFAETDEQQQQQPPATLQEEVAALPADAPAPPAALTGIESEPMAYLTAMDFQQLPDRVRLRLKTDRGIDYQIVDRPDKRQVLVEIQNANIANKLLKRALDTGEFDGPVALVKAFEGKIGALPGVKVLFQLRDHQKAQVTRVGSELLVDFKVASKSGKLFEIAGDVPVLPETILSSFDKMKFSGQRMNLRVKEAPLADVLALISRASSQDFVLAKSSDRKVTIQMNDAPWDQVLAMILLDSNMGYQKIGNTYRIAPAEDLRRELDAAVESEKKKKLLATLETRIFPVNYAKASELDPIIKNFLTKERGSSSVEQRTNSIVVTDVSEVLDRVGTYLKTIDLQTPQVLIEARIVQADDIFTKNLDFRWQAGGTDSFVNIGKSGPGASSVLPDSGLRFSTSLPGIDAITALLNMYETQNQTKIISSPRVMTLNNQKAVIADGTEIVITTPATADTPATQTFKEAVLKLEVTPSITSDGYVRMEIQLNKDEPVGTLGNISKKQANTTLMVESGKTAVIGGVFIDSEIQDEAKMSYLGSLPVVGRLFTPFKQSRKDRKELLMFISPKILNADKATLMSSGANSEASF